MSCAHRDCSTQLRRSTTLEFWTLSYVRALAATFGIAAGIILGVGPSRAEDAPSPSPQGTSAEVTVELNKLEPQDADCRVYFVVNNTSATAYQTFLLELVTFQPDGVVARHFSVEFAPLRATKRAVKIIVLKNQACDGVGSLLVNDVMDCKSDAGVVPNCLGLIAVSSISKIPLTK